MSFGCCSFVDTIEASNVVQIGEIIGEKPTYEDIVLWATSFDRLMGNKGQKMFAEFLKSEFSDENILFWMACEELKKEKNQAKIEEKARIIYEDFISILSPKEVSLDARVREIVNNNMTQPGAHTFDEAQEQVVLAYATGFLSSISYVDNVQRFDGLLWEMRGIVMTVPLKNNCVCGSSKH